MYDRNTGKPRGFGFITYIDEMSVDLVMMHKNQHKINGKWVECKRATPKSTSAAPVATSTNYPQHDAPKTFECYNQKPEGQYKHRLTHGSHIETLKVSLVVDQTSGNSKPSGSIQDSHSTSDITFPVQTKNE